MSEAMEGKEVVVMKAVKPLVRSTSVAAAPTPRKIGTAKGDFEVPEDFDAPLPDHILDEFEM